MLKILQRLYVFGVAGTAGYIAGSYPSWYFPGIWGKSIIYSVIWPFSWYKMWKLGVTAICYDQSKDFHPHAIAHREYIRTGDLRGCAGYLSKTLYAKK